LGLNLGEAFAWIKIVVENDMKNLNQQAVEKLCLMWNRTILGVLFISGFCVYGLQSIKPNTCFSKVHFHMGEREV
jgi:hypothetical protein